MELESEFARISAGVLPASSVPKSIIDQTEFVGWDHEKRLGMIWRVPDPSTPDDGYQNVAMIEGLSVREHEKVVVLVEERLRAIIPNGEWLMKREYDTRKEGFKDDQRYELVWVDLREFETSRKLLAVPTEGGKKSDFDCTLHFRVTDPGIMVRNLILEENVLSGRELDLKIDGAIEGAVSGIAKLRLGASSSIVQPAREALAKRIGDWGMELVSLKLDRMPEPRKEAPHPPPREPITPIGTQRQPPRAIMEKAILKPEQQTPANIASLDVDWETVTKRWIPLTRKGEIKCDGCGNDVDYFAECNLTCRLGNKCKLCKDCFIKRKLCAFS